MNKRLVGSALALVSVLSVGCYSGKKAVSIAANRSGCEKDNVEVVRQDGNNVVLNVCGTHEDWKFNPLNGWVYVAPSVDQPAIAQGSGDADEDGVTDSVDACPTQAGMATDDIATNGCPPPPDGDNDGIADGSDACVSVAGVANADPQKNGCPADGDDDGVADVVDACADKPGVATTDPATNGCPPDADGDGITDDVDACPAVAGVASTTSAINGCADADGDGITDDVDACGDKAGVANEEARKNGCPDGETGTVPEPVKSDAAAPPEGSETTDSSAPTGG